MYVVMEGYLTEENMTSVPSVNTVLGMVKNEDYTFKMFNDPDNGQLKFTGRVIDGIGNILSVTEACNGVVYVTDRTLRPADRATQLLANNNDASISVYKIFLNGHNCNVSLPDAVAALPNTELWVNAWEKSGMTGPLSNSLLSSTQFIPQKGVMADSSTTAAQLYNMLKGEYCPDELVAAGSINSMLGELTKTDLPLRFEKDVQGNVIVTGAVNRAKVISKSIGCNSVVLTTDQPLLLPAVVASTAVAVPATLPTKSIRHITCNPIVYLDDGGPVPSPPGTDSSNSSSSLAIGLGVGLGCAALAVAAAAFVIHRRRRHRRSKALNVQGKVLSTKISNYSGGTNGVSSLVSTEASSFGSVPASDLASSLVTFPSGELAAMSKSTGTKTLSSQLSRLGSTDPGSIDLWEIDADFVNIAIDERGEPVQLGKGSFGAVYRGTLRGVQPTAIKVLNASVGNEAEAAFQREAAILKHVNRDRNVVQLYGTSKLPDGKLLLLTELMEGGDLRRALSNSDATEALAWQKAGKSIALDIARGLTALHAVNVVHRDLKSKNVLLTSSLEAKIGDVGIAAVQTQAGYLTASAGQVVGTLAWSAPELLLGKRCTEKVDIYSFGIVLWELATGNVPQRGFTHAPPPSERCPIELLNLIEACTDEDPTKRPSAKDVFDMLLEIPPVTEP